IDMNLQQAADEAVEGALRQFGDTFRVRQAAMAALEPDGAVRAMVGGRDYGESQFNRATSALRQPGSSFKPFVYATAMLNGFTPESIIRDAPICIGNWCPRNYSGGYVGSVSLTRALVKSINTVPVRLAQAIGRDKIVEVARNMGITSELRITRSLPLGASEVTVLDMAAGFSVFANGGYRAPPHAFTQIINSRGHVVYDRRRDAAQPTRALDEQAVAAMNEILVQIPEWGTGRRAKLDGIRTAGKTGTTSAYRDAWFVGFTGNYTAAVWFGNDNYAPTRRLTGGRLPAQTWKQFMTFAHRGVALKPIPLIADPQIEDAAARTAGALALEGDGLGNRQINLSVESTLRLQDLQSLLQRLMPLDSEAAAGPTSRPPYALRPGAVTGFLAPADVEGDIKVATP
ncbi:MAG: transglycosylase domain-containing protein, partial [Alphaproteobacteria bacterium]